MTSPKQRRGKPIESVALKIAFRADRNAASKIREALPTAVLRGGVCEVRIEGELPSEVAEKAKALLEKLKSLDLG